MLSALGCSVSKDLFRGVAILALVLSLLVWNEIVELFPIVGPARLFPSSTRSNI